MKPTIKQLQDTIKAKDALLKDYEVWLKLYSKGLRIYREREGKSRARIKFLTNSIAALQKDYDKLKRTRKRK
jgi:hypothetical protein